ncbi:nitrate- and nitrite sensing domain-containing protein [Spirillospora sp. NPDC047279]|uniref:sensor histidine kinase n=1 Tax=Spirillospora sp. NPDC047279 TaxID=3155478 RepID=UPI0033CE613D
MATRLVVLILIPAMVAGVLAGLRMRDAMGEADVYTRIERLATLGDRVAGLVHELEDERDLTVSRLTLAQAVKEEDLAAQRAATDQAAQRVRGVVGGIDGAYSEAVLSRVSDIRYRLNTLPDLRKMASQPTASAFSTLEIYGQVISSLLAFDDLIAEGSPNSRLAESSRAFAAIARAKEGVSQERARVSVALLSGGFVNDTDRERVQANRAQQDTQVGLFRGTANTGQRQRYEDTVTGPETGEVESIFQQVIVGSGDSASLSVRPLRARDQARWNESISTRIEQMRQVEQGVAKDLVDTSGSLKDDAWRAGIIDGIVLLLGLLLAGAATVIIARSLVRPLRRLRDGALEVAGSRLPGLVDRLRDPEAAAGGIEVDPIDIDSTDEIGQVARAFDEVHREAVRLAADEAVLRGNINAMFVNLSRRSQSLIERQLRLIEELEQSERDEEQLANLFRLDHLATRMRRNCENLLVLGGQEQVRRWNRPVPLIDVVRASLSEVEQYERVALRVQGEMTVGGPVVNDLVHLLAELVENATVFSAESTKVTVSGQLLSGGGAMLQITDNGVGMSVEELEQANWRLANPPVIDFSAARRMGLFVVGRLAVRHGIRVELRAAQGGGLTAFVMLPDQVVSSGASGGVGSRNFGAGGREMDSQPPTLSPGAGSPLALSAPAVGSAGAFRQSGNDDRSPNGPVPRPRETGPQPSLQDLGSRGSYQEPYDSRPSYQDAPLTSYQDDPRPSYQDDPRQSYQDPPRSYQDDPRSLFQDQRPPYQEPPRPPYQNTGPLPVVSNNTGPLPRIQGTGPQQIVSPLESAEGRTGGLPIREPGAQHPSRVEPPSQTGPLPAVPDPRHTGPLPAVPEAQPRMPERQAQEPNRRQVSWETGPQPALPAAQGWNEPPQQPGGLGQGLGQGGPGQGLGHGGPGQGGHGGGPRQPAPFTLEEPVHEAPAPEPVVRSEPPRRVPERSPIFDAMQSEWFQRRSDVGGGMDPVKGWESPADAGFQAAEAVREPVASKKTSVGLPKRVPGKNRVPGAVTAPATQPGGQAGAPAAQPPAPRQGQSADVVRNRFASLQRGVHRGRSGQGYGGTGESTGEGPSPQGGGETGGDL